MNIQKKLGTILQKFDLNQTQFYQAWSSGTLTRGALQVYANEYGNFIGQLSEGWKTLGEKKQAEIEDVHYNIWKNDFCEALEVEVGAVTLPAIAELMDSAQSMFSKKTQALGALYIFIAQQASTSQSKLEGIKKYYHLPVSSESYFTEHLRSDILAEKLLSLIEDLPEDEQHEVAEAAEIFAQRLFQALEGIYEKYHSQSCSV